MGFYGKINALENNIKLIKTDSRSSRQDPNPLLLINNSMIK